MAKAAAAAAFYGDADGKGTLTMLFTDYRHSGFYDEMFDDTTTPRLEYADVAERISRMSRATFNARTAQVDQHYATHGITFAHDGRDQTFPFDLLPRVIDGDGWNDIEVGLIQRVRALDLFLGDIYGERRCIRDGVVPNSLIATCSGYLRAAVGIAPPGGRRIYLAGVDLVRDDLGEWRVLEDNLRNPSGLSYLLQNRAFMRRLMPEAFAANPVRSVDDSALRLRETLTSMAPGSGNGCVVLLSPGHWNAAYAEHAYLAQQMGAELVEGRDLVMRNRRVWIRTTSGLRQVSVVYRRIDDAYLDPASLRSDSLLGVSGLLQAYRDGNVVIANAPGNGVADDKALYVYVPDLVRYYLDEEPLLKQVPTFTLNRARDLEYVLDNLDTLVVKAVDGAGGYGMMIGPQATPDERSAFGARVRQNPRGYIAQEVVKLSRAPVYLNGAFAARHVDLRPFVMFGQTPTVVPGGLTRVALREGSLVVNSSQGGGSKDTWVLGGPA
jgi:uncharacterized circularly permuted ATP-grasp superfamily protein